LTSVVQAIWLTVNKRPSATAAKLGMMTILPPGKLYAHPLPSASLSTRYGW
jgi:hypothetical protein